MQKTQLTGWNNEWYSKQQQYIGTLIEYKTDNEQIIWNFHFPNQWVRIYVDFSLLPRELMPLSHPITKSLPA